MPEYQFDLTISVAATVIAETEAEAKEMVDKAVDETLFATGPVDRNDMPTIADITLIAVDGRGGVIR